MATSRSCGAFPATQNEQDVVSSSFPVQESHYCMQWQFFFSICKGPNIFIKTAKHAVVYLRFPDALYTCLGGYRFHLLNLCYNG